jgi:hypothetical protein
MSERRKIMKLNEMLLPANVQFAQCADGLELDALLLIKMPADSMQLHNTQSTSMVIIKGERAILAAILLPLKRHGR